ncbi:phage major capsid protein [Clostridium prolinivorans]|uniref:phage major capsid protein n=1 Tax=Clostridium prolinivorans TaxID=2769420 RepID=UPI00389923CF
MKGKEENNQNLSEGFDNAGAYVAPDEFREGFNTALAKVNIFRRFATVINLSSAEGKIQAVSSTGTADWVEDGDPIPESADTFTQFLVKSYKLASLVKLNRSLTACPTATVCSRTGFWDWWEDSFGLSLTLPDQWEILPLFSHSC